jgi:hypothetical protein
MDERAEHLRKLAAGLRAQAAAESREKVARAALALQAAEGIIILKDQMRDLS